MASLPADPLGAGIADFGRRLRAGQTTAEAATAAYLDRIAALDPRLGAYQHVDPPAALAQARAIDALLKAGTDLGPLMGVPVAIKDLFAIEGTPVTAGSKLDVTAVVGPEGWFVKRLRRLGCVLLGKTKTVEFALGATGVNTARGTPWNPCDAKVHRTPGGSSSGSAAAMAAGLCGFAIGTDTGGSVRAPASFCGIFGLKTTVGLWPTDGCFPLSHTLDSIGPLTRSAADAAIVWAAISDAPVPQPAPLTGLRFGKPANYFFDDLEDAVARTIETALVRLAKAGVEIVPVTIPELVELPALFPSVVPAELIAALGAESFRRGYDAMDATMRRRAEPGLTILAADYVRAVRRIHALAEVGGQHLAGLDGWLTPTTPHTAQPVAPSLADLEESTRLSNASSRNTRPGNLFRLSGISTPVQALTGTLPVGLQTLCRSGGDADALAIGLAFEQLFGPPPVADLSGFL